MYVISDKSVLHYYMYLFNKYLDFKSVWGKGCLVSLVIDK